MKLKRLALSSLALATATLLGTNTAIASLADGTPYTVEVDQAGYKIDGDYMLLRGGTVQWFRLPTGAWRDRLERFKAAGFNTIDMYIAWNQIEKTEGVFDFANPNITEFLDLCKEMGIFVYFRPGPYITNEMDGGGVPGWLMDKTTKKSIAADGKVNLRTEDPDYLAYVDRYFGELNDVIKPYLASNGGPIILYSVENEYNWFEIFHEADKLFAFEGGTERNLNAFLPTRNYFTALRDMVINDGIDVPITTCPGDGKASATGDVADIIPMPNIYGSTEPEKVAYDLLNDMHNPSKHGGEYVNFASATTETDREPVRIKRFYMGGLDGAFAFNIAGYHTEGKLNSVTMDIGGVDKIIDTSSVTNVLTGFLAPTVGYFHNVVDFGSAITPSAQLRDKYYSFRRDNLFFESVEKSFASATHAKRSGSFSGADNRLSIANNQVGAKEGFKRINYWHESPTGEKFIGLVNMTGQDQVIAQQGIELDGEKFPRFSAITTKPERDPNGGTFGHADDVSASILLADYGLAIGKLDFATSDVLSIRDFNNDQLFVVYGHANTQGEIQISGFSGTASVDHADNNVTVNENNSGLINISYDHVKNSHAVISANGQTLRVLITTKPEAAKVWFLEGNGQDVVVAGPDYLNPGSTSINFAGFNFDMEFDADNNDLMVMSSVSLQSVNNLLENTAYNGSTLATQYAAPRTNTQPVIAGNLLSNGKAKSDIAESTKQFDDSSWTNWNGKPQSMESLGAIKGHVWYRTELELTGWNWLPWWDATDLYIEHASDIVGIYVNGTYLTTMAPLGTELDSNSLNRKYQYPSLRPYLKKGKNIIAFRVEVWGHGSFMFPRGKILGAPGQIPAAGFDSEKGLFGEAKVGHRTLRNWSMRADLGGDIAGYAQANYNDSAWNNKTFPASIPKGDVEWYRTSFDAADLPNADSLHAPVVIALEGKNAKASIYVNGTLIGRWLSDTDWLSRGFWGRATRDMWMNTNPDHFPLDRSLLKPAGQQNNVTIVFEDTSSDVEASGNISKLAIQYAEEINGSSTIKSRSNLTFEW